MKPPHGPSTDDIMPGQRKTDRATYRFTSTLLRLQKVRWACLPRRASGCNPLLYNGHISELMEGPMRGAQDPLPETMPAGDFKAKCLAIMDRVAETGGQVIITKYGHPVAALVPCPSPVDVPELWGSCRDELTVATDLTAPTDLEPDWISDWEAEWNELLPESS